MSVTTLITVTIEGQQYQLEDREYTGAELRQIAGIPERDKLVCEEPDGSETAIPPSLRIRPQAGNNLFVSVRFRRG